MPKEEAPSAASLRAAFDEDTVIDDEQKTVDNEEDEVVDDDTTSDDKDEDTSDAGADEDEGDYTEEEEEAMAQGWNPNYKGKNAVSAGEFIRRGQLFEKISKQSNRLKQLEQQVEFLSKHQKEAIKVGYEQALKDLKTEKASALAEGDHERVVEIDEQISDTKDKIKTVDTTTEGSKNETQELHPDIQEWIDANPWYNEENNEYNAEMVETADLLGKAYIQAHPELQNRKNGAKQVLKHVDGRMKNLYPDILDSGSTSRKKRASVEGGNRRKPTRKARSNGPTHSADELSPEERMVMSNMLRQGNIKSEEEYMKQLESTGFFNNR